MMAQPDVTGDRLVALVDDFAGVRVAVLGDLIVDEFIYGQISRVSREAPVLILEYDSTDIVPGGAGNAANNVAALGGNAIAVGIAGDDEPGRRLLESMRPRIDVAARRAPVSLASGCDQTGTCSATTPTAGVRGGRTRPAERSGSSATRSASTRCACMTCATSSPPAS